MSSSHWFRVTGSGTFQLLLMTMVVALFAVQSSMARPSSASTFRPSIHEYQEKQANRSAFRSSGTPSTPSYTTPACYDCYRCRQHTVCLKSGSLCLCACEVGYLGEDNSIYGDTCTQFNCTVTDGQRDNCSKWRNSYCNASEQLCVCKSGFESRPNKFDWLECQPIPGWTTTSTTSSAASSPLTTSTTASSWFSKNTIMIVGILVFVLVMALTLLYIFGCHCCRKEAKIGDTSGANYRRQAYQPSPGNSKVTSNVSSKANSKASSKAASNATSKATSKINSAKATSKH